MAPATAADCDPRPALPTHKMHHGQGILRSTDEDSGEEFPSLSEVWAVQREAEKGETFHAFWERWERMRERNKGNRSGLPPRILSWLRLIGKGDPMCQSRHGPVEAAALRQQEFKRVDRALPATPRNRFRPRRSLRLRAIFRKHPTRAPKGPRMSRRIQHRLKRGDSRC